MTMEVPLEILDREVALAAGALATAYARGPLAEAPSPLEAHRRVSSRATFVELAEAPGPLAEALRAWVAALTLERVLWASTVRREAAWRAPSITLAEPQIVAFTESPRDLLVRTLREPSPVRGRVFADALARGAGAVHDAARILAERRVEAARLLGADRQALEVPVDVVLPADRPGAVRDVLPADRPGAVRDVLPADRPGAVRDVLPADRPGAVRDPGAALAAIAERLLAETAPLRGRAPSWSAALSRSVARDAGEGWPARLNERWLFDLFREGPLTEGLRPAIAKLPAPIGASSFARALGAFGAALAEADGPRTFFSIARAPFDLRRPRRAALFAGLAADPVFARQVLGLGRGRARDQARDVARATLISLRLDAARVLCRGVLSLPEGERVARFEEHTATALGAPIPPALSGVVPRLGPDDPSRFAGALLAANDRRALIQRFDEDWFRSPHAGNAIREEDATTLSSHRAKAASLEAGLAEIVRVLGEL
jgi:hypothetical protein